MCRGRGGGIALQDLFGQLFRGGEVAGGEPAAELGIFRVGAGCINHRRLGRGGIFIVMAGLGRRIFASTIGTRILREVRLVGA
jgi:hypothetical protein